MIFLNDDVYDFMTPGERVQPIKLTRDIFKNDKLMSNSIEYKQVLRMLKHLQYHKLVTRDYKAGKTFYLRNN